MAYLEFDKKELVNLSYSLNKELLRSNRRGAFSCTSLIFCNTRKYHGLLIAPQPAIDNELHVLLSSVDPTIIQNNAEFNLGIHAFPGGVYYPKGHKYIEDLTIDPMAKTTYRVGGVVFSIESIFSSEADRVMIKYTLVDCHSETKIRLRPFLAFRQRHQLSKANDFVNKKYTPSINGVSFRMYQGYTPLFMQFTKDVEYIHVPDWYYNVEYLAELKRGYEGHEDLFVPGYFEMSLKKGESVILAAGIDEVKPSSISRMFQAEVKKRVPRKDFLQCLTNSAQQFIYKRDNKTEIIAGYPWFGRWGRDTFISLPGLTLSLNNAETCKAVLDTMSSELNGPLFPNIGANTDASYNSIDAPMWYFWSLQQYTSFSKDKLETWNRYGKKMKLILYGYRNGTEYNIKMQENGLIWGGQFGKSLTWMDAISNGKSVTPRIGMNVEINALWYNAIMFSLELAKEANDTEFTNDWQWIADKIPHSFKDTFWSKDRGYLADYVDGNFKDWSVRPNMVFATSLPYTPISAKIRQLVLNKIESELLTTRGLRTLSPNNPDYIGVYRGDQATRDSAYHQGTVWPWLIGHYIEGYLKIQGKSGIRKAEYILEKFEEVMTEHGIGSISEIYDGDPPHYPRGAFSQAWSVAEIIRAKKLVSDLKMEYFGNQKF